jgi:hypothetical protein
MSKRRELDSDLRATADELQRDAARVQRVERQKAALGVLDPRAPALAREAELITASMVQKARAERELTEEARTLKDSAESL